MSDVVELRLKQGGSVFIEADKSFGQLRSVAEPQSENGLVTESFELVSSALAAVAEEIEEKMATLVNRPSKVVVELSANVAAGGSIFIANGTAQGAIKLQMTWES
ncbi:MAG: CU044_2847 family protein [Methyloligellaceae bacterium]